MEEDKIIGMLLNHEERLQRIEENMATKADLREIAQNVDFLVHQSKKFDQELTMLTHGFRRHEDRIDKLETRVGLV